MKKHLRFLLLAVCGVGCTDSNADVDLDADIADRGTQFSILVDAYVHGSPVEAPLDDASGALRVRGQSFALVADKGRLTGDFTLSPPAATDEAFELEVSSHGTTTTLVIQAPPAIDLTAPFPPFVPRSQDLTIAWTTASDVDMDWYVEDSECLVGFSGAVDPGSTQLTIPASMFEHRGDFTKQTCSSLFDLQRNRVTTDASSPFAAAYLSYERHSDAPFASTP